MNTDQSITPGEGWRLLTLGEMPEGSDEVWINGVGPWVPYNSMTDGAFMRTIRITLQHFPVRRRIEQPAPVGPAVDDNIALLETVRALLGHSKMGQESILCQNLRLIFKADAEARVREFERLLIQSAVALETSYNACEFPADGTSDQEVIAKEIRANIRKS